jgi:hypothetical protein
MGFFRRLILLSCLVSLASCAKKRSLEVPEKPAPAPRAPSYIDAYGTDGKLKGSEVRVEWLEIPLAFAKTNRDYERHRVFEAKGVQLERVREFFAERMLTGMVEETRGDVFYKGVMSPSGGEGAVRLNVRLSDRPAEGLLRLDIERLTYDGAQPLPVEEARRALAAEQKNAH